MEGQLREVGFEIKRKVALTSRQLFTYLLSKVQKSLNTMQFHLEFDNMGVDQFWQLTELFGFCGGQSTAVIR